MKILELFSGYGTASFALKRLAEQGIIENYECVGYSDIDKYANQCFKQNHCTNDTEDKLRLGDVKLVNPNELEDFDLLTGGFPCQAFSVAGKGLGELDPRGTLFYEIIRIAEVKKPKYMLLENVKGLTYKKFKSTFDKILSELDRIGYNVYWKVLNSKDYGIPQSRARVWFVCFRKDIDKMTFNFPEPVELKIFVKDILEEEVDEKYFLNEEQIKRLIQKPRSFNERFCKTECSPTLCARDYKDPKIVQVNNPTHSNERVYSEDGISPTINSMNGGNRQPFILRGRPKMPYEKGKRELEYKRYNDVCPTISQNCASGDQKNIVMNTITEAFGRGGSSSEHIKMVENILGSVGSIRKLTPKECFRLMGFLNDEINLEGLSDTRRYKLAGNGQSINVVEKIFKEMFK